MRLLVDLIEFLAALAVSPIILYRALTTGKYRQGWGERRGFVPLFAPAALWPRVWVHAVSMGEVNAIRGLVTAWRERSPGTEFIISTTTDTGQARARELFPDLTVIRYPLDLSRFVRRALDRIKPTMVVLAELEVWFQFIAECKERNIPVTIVNGRLSERSVRRFGIIKGTARKMFTPLTWVGAQDDAYAERFKRMGVPDERVQITGSLKWDTAQVADAIPGSDALAASMGIDLERPLWVCGSTGPGEEEIVLRAYAAVRKVHPRLALAIIPRKPERFDEVAELIGKAGFECVRRSRCPDGATRQPTAKDILLGDTMGELRKFYSLATAVFVGRTIAQMGGSDMMEVAGLAKPILVGPHTENFADAVYQLKRHEAIRIVESELEDPVASDKLAQAVTALLNQPEAAKKLAANARKVVQENRGATARTLARLIAIAETQPLNKAGRSAEHAGTSRDVTWNT